MSGAPGPRGTMAASRQEGAVTRALMVQPPVEEAGGVASENDGLCPTGGGGASAPGARRSLEGSSEPRSRPSSSPLKGTRAWRRDAKAIPKDQTMREALRPSKIRFPASGKAIRMSQ